MTALYLDLGTTMGWCHDNYDGACVKFQPKKLEPPVTRFINFGAWLRDAWALRPFSKVYYEEVVANFNGSAAAKVYGGLECTLLIFCKEMEIECIGVPVGSIKKHARTLLPEDKQINRKGHKIQMNKDLVIEAMFCAGYTPQDNNHADALAIREYVREIK